MGYHRAGFDVVGVDIKPMPNYPFTFIEGDAMAFMRGLDPYSHGYAAIHASPPCQAFTAMGSMPNAREHEDLLTPTLAWLDSMSTPYVVENVMGAPMRSAVRLCGTAFGLMSNVPGRGDVELRRHRLFETNWPLMVPGCAHKRGRMVVGFYGDHHARIRRRSADGGDITGTEEKMRLVKEAMGIDWMTWSEANQSFPPAYTEYIGKQLLAVLA